MLAAQRFEIAPPPLAIDLAGRDLASGSTTWTALPDLGETTVSAENPRRELDYMHARFRSPLTSRFLSTDPVVDIKAALRFPQMWNRYSYVHNSPLNKVDPDGRLAYHMHFLITYKAARESGMNRRDSLALAWQVVKVDHREGSQGKDAAASNLHAMRGTKADGRPQSIKEGRAGTEASIKGSLASGDLAGAIHTAQDRAAPRHADKVWGGAGFNADTAKHLKGDVSPDAITVGLAGVNTTNVIEAHAAGSTSPIVYSGSSDDQP